MERQARERVYKRVKISTQNGENLSTTIRKFPENIQMEICELYKRGYSCEELDKAFHASHTTICKILKEHGIPRRSYKEAGKIDFFRGKKTLENKNPITIPADETKKAYLAGIIDGEGSIIFLNGRVDRPLILVTNTNPELIEWIKNTFGGLVYSHKQSKPRKTKLEWKVYSIDGCLRILESVFPYLIIKREKAREAIIHIKEECNKWKELSHLPTLTPR
jgi:hypothetical protein